MAERRVRRAATLVTWAAPALLAAAAAVVLHAGITAGLAEGRTARQAAAGALRSRIAVESAQAADRMRRVVETTRDRGDLHDLPFQVQTADVAWTPVPTSPAADADPLVIAALRQETTSGPAAALATYRRIAEGASPTTASRALVEAGRVLAASGRTEESAATLRSAAEVEHAPDNEALRARLALSRLDPGVRDDLRRRLVNGDFAGADLTDRLGALREIAPNARETLALAAAVALRDASDASSVVLVGGTHVAWELERATAIRIALVPLAEILSSLLPCVAEGLVAARPVAGASELPPMPRLDLAPTPVAIATFAAAAARAARPQTVSGILCAAALVAAAMFSILHIRGRAALDRRKDAFLCAVTHELKTPVANVLLYAETIGRHGAEDPGRVAEFSGVIASEALRLERRIADLLEVASGRAEAPRADDRFDALDVVRAAVAEAASGAAARGRTFEANLDIGPASARGSADGLRRAVAALLDNALVHGEGCVRANSAREAGRLRVVVDDEGPGLPIAERDRVFDPFVRLGDELTRATPGTGLGLTIARQGAALCGGDVRFEARGGRGARVVLEIPTVEG